MKIEIVPTGPVLGEKRQALPFSVRWTCPECAKVCAYEQEWYLDHPKLGGVTRTTLWCSGCDHEEEILLRINVTAEVVDIPFA